MTPATVAKLVLAGIGIVIWAYGARYDEPSFRWVGIGFFVAALFLRLWKRDRREPSDEAEDGPESD